MRNVSFEQYHPTLIYSTLRIETTMSFLAKKVIYMLRNAKLLQAKLLFPYQISSFGCYVMKYLCFLPESSLRILKWNFLLLVFEKLSCNISMGWRGEKSYFHFKICSIIDRYCKIL